jgi:hypothetical protein
VSLNVSTLYRGEKLGPGNELLMFSMRTQDALNMQILLLLLLLLLFSSVAFNLLAELHLSVCQHVRSAERPVKCSESFVKASF